MTDVEAGHEQEVLGFVRWVVIGSLASFGVLAILTIGLVLLVVAGVLLVIVFRTSTAHRGTWGVVSGIGVGPLYIAYLNRDGPGTVCHQSSSSSTCIDKWSPWPWFVMGLLFVAVGMALAVSRARREETPGRSA